VGEIEQVTKVEQLLLDGHKKSDARRLASDSDWPGCLSEQHYGLWSGLFVLVVPAAGRKPVVPAHGWQPSISESCGQLTSSGSLALSDLGYQALGRAACCILLISFGLSQPP
ncbi:hypothetical protein, partial [Stenotrophomonas cyclobalanopsidis]|uniref:hypothetical protein n=1 Tax=Stenotrophomonas cyclobalanopsidis TaxID=2771362 RepID=UPI001CB7082A